jgi:hypothetical protein
MRKTKPRHGGAVGGVSGSFCCLASPGDRVSLCADRGLDFFQWEPFPYWGVLLRGGPHPPTPSPLGPSL